MLLTCFVLGALTAQRAKSEPILADLCRKTLGWDQQTIMLAVAEEGRKKADNTEAAEAAQIEKVRARHILVASKEEAERILARLKKGDQFEDLAKQFSLDGSKDFGGDIGYFTAAEMVPAFSKAAFALKPGEISKPVKTDFGWHVIKVEDIQRRQPTVGDCRVALGLPREDALADVPANALCHYALGLKRDGWEQSKLVVAELEEAKRRNLSIGDCRIALGLPREAEPILAISAAELCQAALDGAREDWASDASAAKPVAEAKRRTLTVGQCRVAMGLPEDPRDPTLVAAAKQLLADANEYSRLSSKGADGLQLVRLSIALNGALAEKSQSKLKQAYDALDQLLKADNQFTAFLAARADKAKLAAEQESKDRVSVLALTKDFAIYYASRNITAAASVELMPFIDRAATALETQKDEEIKAALKEAQALMARNDLKAEFERHMAQTCGDDQAGNCRNAYALIQRLIERDQPGLIPQADAPPMAVQGKRVALVIGNGAYQHASSLPNPTRDAADMAAALRAIGFDVKELQNADRNSLTNALSDFSEDAAGADFAIVYFAGHGIEVDKQNYLIPVDAKLATDHRLRFEALSLDDVLAALEGVKGIRMVLLDACRNNPFAASMRISSASRSIGRGLSRVEAANGTVISFAAKEGTEASDGDGRNSPFTTALLANLAKPGLEIQFLLRQVRDTVLAATNGKQEPFISASLPSQAVYLVPPADQPGSGAIANSPSATTEPIVSDFQLAKEIGTADAWDAFLAKHGSETGNFYIALAKAARQKLVLSVPSAPEVEPPATPGSGASLNVARDTEACKKVRFADVGWTDVSATTGVANVLLQALGYEPEVQVLSVPVTYQSLKNKDLDVFLGSWMPSMAADVKPYADEGSVEMVTRNLEGAGYGLAVPAYVAEAGVRSLKDIGPNKGKFGGKIYSIEPGNDGNRIILDMIRKKANGLKGFRLIESSEAGMVAQVQKSMKNNEWVVFLAWTPHPVMGEMKITFLDGMGDSGFGAATVETSVRKGYEQECPNAGKFISNLKFSLSMENQMMDAILKGTEANAAATEWLKANPDAVRPWLDGVTTFKGGDAAAAVKSKLGG